MGGYAIHPAPGRPSDSHPSAAAAAGTTSSSVVSSSPDDDAAAHPNRRRHNPPGHTLEEPSRRHRALGRNDSSASSRSARLIQRLRHALPLLTLTPRCGRMSQVGTPAELAAAANPPYSSASSSSSSVPRVGGGLGGVSFTRPCRRVTGTLYGHRRGRVVLALQETPRCRPSLVVELALQTHALLRELGNPAGARIVLETERRPVSDPAAAAAAASGGGGGGQARGNHKRGGGGGGRAPPLLEEPTWTMFCNGKKTGYAVRRDATDDDLTVMETLRPVSMGAGVLPGARAPAPNSSLPTDAAAVADDEVPYMRGCFDHFIGSRDSESLYMIAPQGGGTGPELAVFFVRL